MREVILKAVAAPPKILWGPFLPVLLNLGVQFPFMFMAIGVLDINPLIFIISICLVHTFIVGAGVKDPHISSMLQAYGQANKSSTNLYKQKGNKFAP
ncbi:MAG: hypothetical protein LBL47_04180 [Lactobacillus sp.]|jgi:hypothetical protein|nr:hypothetical protein [Lactobacillus sp.]